MITRSNRLGAPSTAMDSSRSNGGVPACMIPLLEVAFSKCQEAEKDSTRDNTAPAQHQQAQQASQWMARQEQEEAANKKRKRSSNWSEAETLQLLLLRKTQLQSKDERRSCPKGSSAWDEIASQLKEHFTPRSGKHVGERWDTLRRVYMDIEERCSHTQETYAEILDANRELFKFIPTEYTQRWHELIADCKPGKRRGKKTIESGSSHKAVPAAPEVVVAVAPPSKYGPAIEDYSVTSRRAPLEACSEGTLREPVRRGPPPQAEYVHREYVQREYASPADSGIASAFGTLITDVERVISCQKKMDKSGQACGKKNGRRARDVDERAEAFNGVEVSEESHDSMEMNVVASLQSVLAALKSASEFTSSESYLLKIDKREWNLVENNVRAFSERHRNSEQTRSNGVVERTFSKIVWPPDDPDPTTIAHEDVKSLEPGGQLSDNIVNFYLKYLHCKNTRIPDVQIFKTFTKSVSANLNVVRYGSVRQWMKSIFDKSYVLIPVFKEEQWSLIVMCFPGRPLADGREPSVGAPCILHLNPSRQKAHQDLERHMRFILHYEWLWHHGGHVAPPHVSDIPFHAVAVPQQDNCDDTGLLILQYAELLLKKGPESFSLAQTRAFPFLKDGLAASTAKTMRTGIRQVLLDLESDDVAQKQSKGG